MTDPNTPTPPAGWYDDGSGAMRYWDGSAWTDHTAPAGGDVAAPAPGAPDDSAAAPTQVYGAAATTTATAPSDSAFAPAPESAGAKPHVLGFIALAVAVVGFIFACIPGALIVGWILLPIAFILSIVALFLKGKKWPAIAALITSIVGTIVGVIVFATVVTTSFEEAFAPVEGQGGSSEVEAEDAGEEEAAVDEPAPEVGNLAFGDTMVWDDGVEMTVGAPEPFTPTEYAAGADQATHLLFSFTITNNSTENVEPTVYTRLSSGGQEGSQIFDSGNPAGDVNSFPTTVILPGQSVTWLEAWSVADAASLTMQTAPGWDYEDAIFTNVQ